MSDERLKVEIARIHRDNFGVYGIEKVWRQLKREGHTVGRHRVARLMHDLERSGVVRGKNALAEAVNGPYEAEVNRKNVSLRSLEQVKLATAEWVDWWNQRRLHGATGDIRQAELEALCHHQRAHVAAA